MRTIVLFDLPTLTAYDKKSYRIFRKNLIKNGFAMMQYSCYSKLTLNQSQTEKIEEFIEENKPKKGDVMMLTITEKQFAEIKYLVGKEKSSVVQSDKRFIVYDNKE